VLAGDPAALSGAIATSCRAKAAIVAADPAERTGRRALLNHGHTFGHALEALGGYDGRLLHGEAVAIGMRWAFLYAAAEGLCAAEAGIRMEAHMRKTGLPFTPPFAVRAGDIAAAMTGDKKNAAGRGITLVLPRAIGAAFVSPGHAPATIAGFLKKILETEMTHAR
jgi:3-dehydroquinate synthetase